MEREVKAFSPVTFSDEWPTVARLLFVLFCSSFGTTANGFFVAAFFVERALRKIGYVFLCCLGLSDLIITAIAMPICVVVLLSGQWDNTQVCSVLYLLAEISTYSYSLLAMMVAAESYFRLCRSTKAYEIFMSLRVGIVVPTIFAISALLGTIGVYYKLDYDYCERKHHGNLYFRLSSSVIYHGIPCGLTLFALISAYSKIQRRARQIKYKRSMQCKRDFSITQMNITSYIIYIISWIPYLINIYNNPNASDTIYYYLIWLAFLRCVITSFLYGIINRCFRHAFARIYNYFCCRSSLPRSNNRRHRRVLTYESATGEVRVHFMHQVVSRARQRGNLYETHTF